MCGIAGCVGHENAVGLVLDALELLEYRGYDSCGVAVVNGRGLEIRKTAGHIKALKELISASPINGHCAIGHTRWATHGAANEKNAHPHKAGSVAIVHNGIIENCEALRKSVLEIGRKLNSDTDSELIAHLIDIEFEKLCDPLEAVRRAIESLSGSFAICAVFKGHPDLIIAAKRSSPLVVGLNNHSNFVASDAHAISELCSSFIYLEDDELAAITPTAVRVIDKNKKEIAKKALSIKLSNESLKTEEHEHYMHKEIFEQPLAVWNTIKERISEKSDKIYLPELDALNIKPKRVHLVACGTAYHAALIARMWLESWADIPTNCEHASEFRYREPVIKKDDLFISVSQSGETADTIGAHKYAKSKGAKTLAICNVANSTLARESDAVIYTQAGPELAVASTKAFVAQIAALYLVSLKLFKRNGTLKKIELIKDLLNVPELIEEVLKKEYKVIELAKKFSNMRFYIFLGRQLLYPIAIEGALKLKEISYHFAEGYPAGEMKHGPIALADDGTLVIGLLSQGATYEKTLSNLHEIRSRGAKVLGITFEGDDKAKSVCDEILYLPKTSEQVAPFLWVVPLQLFAYHVAKNLGRPIDKPRNLAKSVTVE